MTKDVVNEQSRLARDSSHVSHFVTKKTSNRFTDKLALDPDLFCEDRVELGVELFENIRCEQILDDDGTVAIEDFEHFFVGCVGGYGTNGCGHQNSSFF
jgi:hypothetical protein